MKIKPLPLSFFVDRLNDGPPFSYVRYGDGEFACMLGREGGTCDGQSYSHELGIDLLRTLAYPRDYLYALGPRAAQGLGIDVPQFMRRRGLHLEWYDSETLIDASTRGDLFPFVRALRQHHVLTVGPSHLRHNPAYGSIAFIETPKPEAYRAIGRVYQEVLRAANQVDVICFSAGPAAKVLIYDLFPKLGHSHYLLDCGSIWDLYCGVNSRGYMRKMDAATRQRLTEQNMGLRTD